MMPVRAPKAGPQTALVYTMGDEETTRELIIPKAATGQRLDVFLRDHLPGFGRAAVKRLFDDGRVRVGDRRAAASVRAEAGQRVIVHGVLSVGALPDPSAPLVLAYEDGSLVVADKPAGMPSHPLAPGELGTLASALLARFPEMANLGYSAREPGIVHRLDTDTSGLVLAARTRAAFDALRAQLDAGAIEKRYLALCAGVPDAALIGAPQHGALVAHGARVHVQLDRGLSREDAQPITTEILRVVSTLSTASGALALLEVKADRARRHQVRAHLAALGHPIAGDERYGGPRVPELGRHFLHASAIRFAHPESGVALRVTSELPAELQAVLERGRGPASDP
jgi:23S rRNA pseudouridine1911/1915/1917 synthase